MALSTEQIELINNSFRQLMLRSNTTAEMFYERLFELHPEVKPLFKSGMKEQQHKFMQTIGTLVAAINLPDEFEAAVRHLGQRHVDYGVKKDHYDWIGDSLIWAIGEVLGDDFTDETRAAWEELYGMISSIAAAAHE